MSEIERRRVLMDESMDRLLKPLFASDVDVVTTQERGWVGLKNGELLRAAEAEFDVFVTMDRSLPYQQNLAALNLAVVVVRAVSNAYVHVAPRMPDVNVAVQTAEPGVAVIVTR